MPRAVRAHGQDLRAVGRWAPMQLAVVSSAGIEYGALDSVVVQAVAQSALAHLVVGEGAVSPAGPEMCVEPVLADIAVGDDSGDTAAADDWVAIGPLASLAVFMS